MIWNYIANFRKYYLKSGHKLDELAYQTPFYPIVPWLVIILCSVSIIGIAFDPNQRIALIIGIPFTILCFFYYQLFFSKKASVAIENQEVGELSDEF